YTSRSRKKHGVRSRQPSEALPVYGFTQRAPGTEATVLVAAACAQACGVAVVSTPRPCPSRSERFHAAWVVRTMNASGRLLLRPKMLILGAVLVSLAGILVFAASREAPRTSPSTNTQPSAPAPPPAPPPAGAREHPRAR